MERDLISRAALYDAMREKEWQNWPPLDEIDAVIEKAPAVDDVEVVRHGEWIGHGSRTTLKCSECGKWQPAYYHAPWSYCPNCGAKMDGGKQDA